MFASTLITTTAVAIVAILGVAITAFLRRYRGQWLSSRIDEELKSLDEHTAFTTSIFETSSLTHRLKRLLATGWSLPIVVTVVLVFHGLFLFIYWNWPFSPLATWQTNTWSGFLSVLWQAHSSIIAITFVVIVLFLEVLGGKLSREGLFKLSIRESYILPIAFAGLSLAGSIGVVRFFSNRFQVPPWWIEALTIASLFSFLIFLGITALLYLQMLQFLRPSWIREARVQIAEEAILTAVYREVRNNLGNHILRRACRELGLYYTPSVYSRQDLVPIQAAKSGQIEDINLKKLTEFAQMLEHRMELATEQDRSVRGFLLRGLDSYVPHGNRVLARIHPDDESEHTIRSLKSSYKMGSRRRDDEPLVTELQALKDEAYSSLRDLQPEAFSQILDFYFGLFEQILQIWRALNASTETTALSSAVQIRPITILQRDFYDILEFAISTQDSNVIQTAMYFPMRIAKLALEADDRQLFVQALDMMPASYRLVVEDHGHTNRSFIVDRSWRYIREFIDYRITGRLRNDVTSLAELSRLGDYVILAIRIFNKLLKAAVEARDKESFEEFGRQLDRLLGFYRPEGMITDYAVLEVRLANEELREDEEQQLQERLNRYEALDKIREQTEHVRKLIWFGISGWLVREISQGGRQQSTLAEMFNSARSHFSNLQELSSLFLAARESDEIPLGWDNWVLSELPEREVHWIDTDSWLQMFYCIQGLRLTPNNIGDDGTPIVSDRQVQFMLERLEETCEQLSEDQEQWQGIVSDQDLERIANFMELHRRTASIARDEQEQWLIEQPISQNKWQTFQERFQQGWRENVVIRALVEKYGTIEDRTNEPPPEGMQAFGINILDDKGAYVEGWHASYFDWGERYGRSMANGEDSHAISQISDALSHTRKVNENEVVNEMIRAVETLKTQGYDPNIILVSSPKWTLEYRKVAEIEEFEPHWSQDCEPLDVPGFEGRFQSIPIVGHTAVSGGLVVDLSTLGRWIQYQVTSAASEILDFRISEINVEEAERRLEDRPELLEDFGVETREEGLRRLQQKVHLQVLERFEYYVDDSQAGIRLEITNADQSSES